MNKMEIENWFIESARKFALEPQNSDRTFMSLVREYNDKYENSSIPEERKFNPVIFTNLFTKVRTIAFSPKTNFHTDFIQNRQLLIIELNRYSKSVALDFARLLSNQSLQSNTKEFLNLTYIIFSHFVEIYNNLHQYKETTIETNMRIAKSYLEEAVKNTDDSDLKKSLRNAFDFLKLVYEENKELLKACSS